MSIQIISFPDLDGKVGNGLFDIEKNLHIVVGREKAFNMDQLSQRECCLSEEIDVDFEESQEQMRQDKEEYNSFVDPEEFKEVMTLKNHVFLKVIHLNHPLHVTQVPT